MSPEYNFHFKAKLPSDEMAQEMVEMLGKITGVQIGVDSRDTSSKLEQDLKYSELTNKINKSFGGDLPDFTKLSSIGISGNRYNSRNRWFNLQIWSEIYEGLNRQEKTVISRACNQLKDIEIIEQIRETSVDRLCRVNGVTRQSAILLKESFKKSVKS